MNFIIVFYFITIISTSTPLILENGNVTLILNITTNDGLLLQLNEGGEPRLTGHIGAGLQLQNLSQRRFTATDVDLVITDVDSGFNIHWHSLNQTQIFQDCFQLHQESVKWFVGREGRTAQWPQEKTTIPREAYTVNVSDGGSIAEPYWLNSQGVFLFVNETTPLFIDQNNLLDDRLCFIAQLGDPYFNRSMVVLNYTLVAKEDAREAHRLAIDGYLGRPTGQPDSKMVREPIWSTFAKYGADIDDQLLVDFAQSVKDNDFRGQVQIEDGWEECYGSLSFKKLKFAAINSTVIAINSMALRVTLWIHPFVNDDCEDIVEIGRENDFFVHGVDGNDLTTWRNGEAAHLVDFTNVEARTWFSDRVQLLITKHVLDGFRFDAGETSWAPLGAVFEQDSNRGPNCLTTDYNSASNFTTFVHVHSGWRTQWVPVFVSITEKESNWGVENGLRAVIVSLLQLNLAGYTMVHPGTIGGQSVERPSAELLVRWTQAVTFMPVMQFGHLPWEIIGTSFDVLAIVRKYVDLHNWYSDKIINVMKKSQNMGLPVNAPVWWIDQTNPETFNIIDQYMLGEDFVIAPVMTEGATARDVYLPPGNWRDGNNDSIIHAGNRTLKNYPAPIDILPYFYLEKDD